MIRYAQGNLLDAEAEALVNTVNTVGIMGKGIALMFKERFPENFHRYAEACKRGEVEIGRMFVTDLSGLVGPRWIINFSTKKHWRDRTQLDWIRSGLEDLKRVLVEKNIRSVALPPLGCGNGGLDWKIVRPLIEEALADLPTVEFLVYEPTTNYQNVAKRAGVLSLTPARALIAEMVRRYWILGIEGSLLEAQKLAWFLEREVVAQGLENPFKLQFVAHRYGPYSHRLAHLLNALDGSYLRSEVRIPDAKPTDVIAFDDSKRERVDLYLKSEAREYLGALERTSKRIDGFESPLGMELLATVDWLLLREGRKATLEDVKAGLASWSGGRGAGERKLRIFDDRLIQLALKRLSAANASDGTRISETP